MVLNNLDYGMIFVGLYIIVISAKRGFMEELVSSLSLILAFTITYIFGSSVEKAIFSFIEVKFLSMVISYAVMFILFLSIFYYILKLVLPENMFKTGLDRLLGVVFGIVKAIFILLAVSLVINFIFPTSTQPYIIKASSLKSFADSVLSIFFTKYN
jgi:membrane protein required for colicin V production